MKLFIALFILLVITSCSEVRPVDTQTSVRPDPVYIVLNKKSAFEIKDSQRMIYYLKPKLDSITLVKTWRHIKYVERDTTEILVNTGWMVSTVDNIESYEGWSLEGKDSVWTEVQVETFPSSAFSLKRGGK